MYNVFQEMTLWFLHLSYFSSWPALKRSIFGHTFYIKKCLFMFPLSSFKYFQVIFWSPSIVFLFLYKIFFKAFAYGNFIYIFQIMYCSMFIPKCIPLNIFQTVYFDRQMILITLFLYIILQMQCTSHITWTYLFKNIMKKVTT